MDGGIEKVFHFKMLLWNFNASSVPRLSFFHCWFFSPISIIHFSQSLYFYKPNFSSYIQIMLNQDNDDWNEGRAARKKKHTRSSNKTTTLTPSQSNENKQTLWENSREWKNYMIFPFHHFYFNFSSMQTVNVISPDSYLMHEYSSKNMSYAICSGFFFFYIPLLFLMYAESAFFAFMCRRWWWWQCWCERCWCCCMSWAFEFLFVFVFVLLFLLLIQRLFQLLFYFFALPSYWLDYT